jgi:CHAD domain-containing protein
MRPLPDVIAHRPNSKPSNPTRAAAVGAIGGDAISNLACVQELRERILEVEADRDPEAVHRMRVACARLRVWLALGGGCSALDAELRSLRDAAAELRDLDVQLMDEPPRRWPRSQARRHEAARDALLAYVEGRRPRVFLHALAEMPALPRRAAELELRRMARRAFEVRVGRSSPRKLHRARRRVRDLRYACQWLDVDVGWLARLQEILGEARDAMLAARAEHAHPRRDEARARERSRKARAAWNLALPLLQKVASEGSGAIGRYPEGAAS